MKSFNQFLESTQTTRIIENMVYEAQKNEVVLYPIILQSIDQMIENETDPEKHAILLEMKEGVLDSIARGVGKGLAGIKNAWNAGKQAYQQNSGGYQQGAAQTQPDINAELTQSITQIMKKHGIGDQEINNWLGSVRDSLAKVISSKQAAQQPTTPQGLSNPNAVVQPGQQPVQQQQPAPAANSTPAQPTTPAPKQVAPVANTNTQQVQMKPAGGLGGSQMTS